MTGGQATPNLRGKIYGNIPAETDQRCLQQKQFPFFWLSPWLRSHPLSAGELMGMQGRTLPGGLLVPSAWR